MTTLLKTKLTIPPLRPDLVPRPHLVDRLNKGLRPGCCLILVSAPAGFGKTTLVTAWLRQVACPATWLSLDEGDNDPIRFLRYLIAALRKVAPSIAPGLGGALQSPQPPSPEELIASLINQIVGAPAAGVDTPIVLVLDDAHALTAPPVHRALNFLLDHLPANLRIVITTRADPPLPLARLRGRGQIVEVRQTDLRFEPGEAADFLAKILDDTLPDADIETLTSRTEGWPAGLRMAAAALRARAVATGERSPSQFIADFSGSQAYIVDYLGAEVLDRQPAHVRDFLLKTSVLDRFTASLCDAVMASPTATDLPQVRGRQMLPALADANLFLVPLDQKRRWYRYHHLFRDLLRQRLTIASPELPQALHRRASAWYEAAASAPDGSIRDTALMGEAVKHARAAEDPEFLAELLDRHAETLLTAGEIGIVLEGTVGLPVDAIQGRPLLLVFQALGHLVTSRLDAASRSIAAAETATQNAGADATAETTALVGMIAAMQAAIAFMRGEQTEVVERSGYALDHLPKRNHAWRGSAAMTLGDAHTLRGDLRDAAGAYQSAMLESDAADNRFLGLITRIKLADTYRGLGQLHRTGESCRPSNHSSSPASARSARRIPISASSPRRCPSSRRWPTTSWAPSALCTRSTTIRRRSKPSWRGSPTG